LTESLIRVNIDVGWAIRPNKTRRSKQRLESLKNFGIERNPFT
jgi:hypothetical protein